MRRPGFLAPGLFSIYFYFIELNQTKMPVSADLFFGVQVVHFRLVMGFSVRVFWSLGLDI